MINITKTATDGAKAGVLLYGLDKLTNAAGQMAINFLPAAVPVAASVALGGFAVAVALGSLGKGSMMKEASQLSAALAVSNALQNIAAIEDPVSGIFDKLAAIGTTKGYTAVSAGYAPAMAGGRGGMRGFTSIHI